MRRGLELLAKMRVRKGVCLAQVDKKSPEAHLLSGGNLAIAKYVLDLGPVFFARDEWNKTALFLPFGETVQKLSNCCPNMERCMGISPPIGQLHATLKRKATAFPDSAVHGASARVLLGRWELGKDGRKSPS